MCRRCPTGRLTPHPRGGFGNSKYCPSCGAKVEQERERRRAPQKRRASAARRARPGVQERLNREEKERRSATPRTVIDRLYDALKCRRRRNDPKKRAHDRAVWNRGYRRRMKDPVYAARWRARREQNRLAHKQRTQLERAA